MMIYFYQNKFLYKQLWIAAVFAIDLINVEAILLYYSRPHY